MQGSAKVIPMGAAAARTRTQERRTGGAALAVAVAVTLLLSLTDACATVVLIGHGATEANPLMRMLLQTAPQCYFVVKLAGTAAGLLFFYRHRDRLLYGLLRGHQVVYLVLGGYAVLIGYELGALSPVGAIVPL